MQEVVSLREVFRLWRVTATKQPLLTHSVHYFLESERITVKVSKVAINSFSNSAICASVSFKPAFSFSTKSTIPPNQAACLGMMIKRRSPSSSGKEVAFTFQVSLPSQRLKVRLLPSRVQFFVFATPSMVWLSAPSAAKVASAKNFFITSIIRSPCIASTGIAF